MATARLTKSIREALLKKLIRRAFQDRAQEMVDRCSAFAVKVYEDAMGPHLKSIRSIPDGWLPSDDDVKVQIAGDVTRLCFNGSMGSGGLDMSMREAGAEEATVPGSVKGSFNRPNLPYPAKFRGQCVKVYDATDPIAQEHMELTRDLEDFQAEVRAAKRAAKVAMESVTTVKKLIEVWPEVEEFAKDYLVNGERKAILPAIPRAELNAKLGLPPERAEAREEVKA